MMPALALEEGTEIQPLDVGPFTLVDFVRWAAYQENWIRLHYDEHYVLEHRGFPKIVQSGNHRLALIARMLTDWLGSSGQLKFLNVRHHAPVFLGESIRCGGRIKRIEAIASGWRVQIEVWAAKGDGQHASDGSAIVEVRQH